MKGMMLPKIPRRKTMAKLPSRHGVLIRRAANHNAHIITHHGKMRVGRKGRTG